MKQSEWDAISAKLTASYPAQPLPQTTLDEWFTEVSTFEAGEVWLAIRRHRRESRFAPSLAEILAAIDANHRELGEARRVQARQLERLQQHPGVPMPPETREALKIRAEMNGGTVEHEEGLSMIGSLVSQMAERMLAQQHPEAS